MQFYCRHTKNGVVFMELSKRAKRLEPSATLVVTAKSKALKWEGKPVISFGAGEPDFNSPQSAADGAIAAIHAGHTHYTSSNGIPELREAVCAYYEKQFGLKYDPLEVVVDCGAKPLLYEVLACLVNPGDEVIVFTPAWVSYVEQIRLFDGVPVLIDTAGTDFIPDLKALENAITPKTRCIMINTPNNPTGAVYDAQILKGIANLALKHKIAILYDEIYERMVYEGAKHYNIVELCPEVRDLTILINGVSKAFAMTGWRIGYALGEKDFMKTLNDLKGHINTNATSISQYAAVEALKHAEPDVRKMVEAFAKRRKLILGLLKEMPHISLIEPKGAFYAWFNVDGTIGKSWQGKKISSDVDFCELLLEGKYVAGVPGTAFMSPGHVRLSYANSEEEITEGMKRLHEFLKELA